MRRVVDSAAWGLALSLAILAAASIASVALSADAPLIRHTLGLSTIGVGAITSVVYIGAAASSTPGGRFTDRRGPTVVVVISMLLLAAGEGVTALAPSLALFFAGVFIVGLGYGCINPPTNVISNPIDVRRRALSISIKQTGIPIGGTLVGALVAPLAEAHGWRVSLISPIVICLVLAAVCTRWCPRRPVPRSYVGDGGEAIRLRRHGALIFGFLMNGVQSTLFSFLALYLTERRGLSTTVAGAGLSVLLIGGVVGRPLWGWLSDRMHRDRVRALQLNALVAAVAVVLLPVLPLAALYVLLPVIGMTSVGWNGAFIATVAEAASPNRLGVETGRALVVVNIGPVVVPLVFGAIVGGPGRWYAAWAACAAMSVVCAVALQFSRRRELSSVGGDRPGFSLTR